MIDNLNNNIVNNDDDHINDIVNVIDDGNDNIVRENEINQPINQPINEQNEETNVNQPINQPINEEANVNQPNEPQNEPQNEQDNNEQPNNLSPELEEMKKYIPKLFFLVSFYMKCPTILLAEFLIISFNYQLKTLILKLFHSYFTIFPLNSNDVLQVPHELQLVILLSSLKCFILYYLFS